MFNTSVINEWHIQKKFVSGTIFDNFTQNIVAWHIFVPRDKNLSPGTKICPKMYRKTTLFFCGKSQYLVRNRVYIRCQKRPILSKFVKIFVGDTNFCRGTHFSENFDKFWQKSAKFSGKFHSKTCL